MFTVEKVKQVTVCFSRGKYVGNAQPCKNGEKLICGYGFGHFTSSLHFDMLRLKMCKDCEQNNTKYFPGENLVSSLQRCCDVFAEMFLTVYRALLGGFIGDLLTEIKTAHPQLLI